MGGHGQGVSFISYFPHYFSGISPLKVGLQPHDDIGAKTKSVDSRKLLLKPGQTVVSPDFYKHQPTTNKQICAEGNKSRNTQILN